MYNTGDSKNIFLQIRIKVSITSLIYPGNRTTTESKLMEKANGYKTTGNTRWECIEIDDDNKDDHDDLEEKENKSSNVNKNRKTKQQNSRLAQKTPKKEAKTPRKTAQKGRDKMKLGTDLAGSF